MLIFCGYRDWLHRKESKCHHNNFFLLAFFQTKWLQGPSWLFLPFHSNSSQSKKTFTKWRLVLQILFPTCIFLSTLFLIGKFFNRLSWVLSLKHQKILVGTWQTFGLEYRRKNAKIINDGICLQLYLVIYFMHLLQCCRKKKQKHVASRHLESASASPDKEAKRRTID